MKDLLEQIALIDSPVALATIVATWSSAPRQAGAALAVTAEGAVIGSVSVGCVEADIYVRCQEVLESGEADLVTYGVSDGEALAIGLTCGGVMTVFVERLDPAELRLGTLAEAVRTREQAALVTIIEGDGAGSRLVIAGDQSWGTLGSAALDEAAEIAAAQNSGADPRVMVLGASTPVFLESINPPPHMVIFGAVEFAAALAETAALLGYYVTVCDARSVFATPERFPAADEVVVSWPHDYLASISVDASTVLCVLTHDPKFDEPLLEAAVRTNAGYIGAMGSRRTHEDRTLRLQARGLTPAELDRINSPIGLDLGAVSPAETAVSIAAEIIAKRTGRSGRPLSVEQGPLHVRHSEYAVHLAQEL